MIDWLNKYKELSRIDKETQINFIDNAKEIENLYTISLSKSVKEVKKNNNTNIMKVKQLAIRIDFAVFIRRNLEACPEAVRNSIIGYFIKNYKKNYKRNAIMNEITLGILLWYDLNCSKEKKQKFFGEFFEDHEKSFKTNTWRNSLDNPAYYIYFFHCFILSKNNVVHPRNRMCTAWEKLKDIMDFFCQNWIENFVGILKEIEKERAEENRKEGTGVSNKGKTLFFYKDDFYSRIYILYVILIENHVGTQISEDSFLEIQKCYLDSVDISNSNMNLVNKYYNYLKENNLRLLLRHFLTKINLEKYLANEPFSNELMEIYVNKNVEAEDFDEERFKKLEEEVSHIKDDKCRNECTWMLQQKKLDLYSNSSVSVKEEEYLLTYSTLINKYGDIHNGDIEYIYSRYCADFNQFLIMGWNVREFLRVTENINFFRYGADKLESANKIVQMLEQKKADEYSIYEDCFYDGLDKLSQLEDRIYIYMNSIMRYYIDFFHFVQILQKDYETQSIIDALNKYKIEINVDKIEPLKKIDEIARISMCGILSSCDYLRISRESMLNGLQSICYKDKVKGGTATISQVLEECIWFEVEFKSAEEKIYDGIKEWIKYVKQNKYPYNPFILVGNNDIKNIYETDKDKHEEENEDASNQHLIFVTNESFTQEVEDEIIEIMDMLDKDSVKKFTNYLNAPIIQEFRKNIGMQ